MREVERICDQMERAYHGPAWHGPALLSLLNRVTPESALARPIAAGHTIWELTLHIITWYTVAREALTGEYPHVRDELDWPQQPDAPDADAWQQVLARLQSSHQLLLAAIRDLSDDLLADDVPGKDFSIYSLLHGVIQHNTYHTGQITLLQRAIEGQAA